MNYIVIQMKKLINSKIIFIFIIIFINIFINIKIDNYINKNHITIINYE